MNSAAEPVLAAPSGACSSENRGILGMLSGFFVSGLLLAFPGAILPAWQAHLTYEFTTVGKYFLALSLGIFLGIRLSRRLLVAKGVVFSLVCACLLSSMAFLFLAFVPPPAVPLWRLLGLFFLGGSAALLNAGLFHAVSPLYERDHAAALNLAGALFCLGCLVAALLVALTFYTFSVQGILILFAIIPPAFAVVFAKSRLEAPPIPAPPRNRRLKDLRTPLAVLLGLLLLFQFGNEWCIAGWLPVFLIRRIGSSPAASLILLACFWAMLLVGRFVAQAVLPRLSHPRLLIGSVFSEFMGYLLLTMTDNLFGACVGILCLASGFALIYPLVAEKIGGRFPHYHPGFFDGIFTFAFGGGLLAPWLLGYMAAAWGIRAVMVLPLIGTVAVFVLLLLIMLEAVLSDPKRSA